MSDICEFCKIEFKGRIVGQRFCNFMCQRKHYNRRPQIREKCRLRRREYRASHPEWREKHRIQQAKYKEKRKLYRKEYYQRQEVKKMLKEKRRWKLKNNLEFAIADRLRKSLRHALKKYSNTGKIMSSKKYGLNWTIIIDSLKPFPQNIKEYEIDHIMPLHKFNLTNLEEVKEAFSPKNLQWLTKTENRVKGGRIISLPERK